MKVRRGDIVNIRKEYKTLGNSDYTGIVYTCNPTTLFPVTGHRGRVVMLDQSEYEVTDVLNLGSISRFINMLKSAWRIGGE